MKIPTEFIIAFVVFLVIYLYRTLFIALFKNSVLGRLIVLSLILAATLKKPQYGVVAAVLYIIVNNTVIEGMSNNSSKDETADETADETENDYKVEINDAVASFKNKHCKDGKLVDKDGNPIDIKDLASHFPEISFNLEKGNTCNPCAEKCNFKLTSSDERIAVEEKMRPVDSATVSTT